jgi:hypothetical protein
LGVAALLLLAPAAGRAGTINEAFSVTVSPAVTLSRWGNLSLEHRSRNSTRHTAP